VTCSSQSTPPHLREFFTLEVKQVGLVQNLTSKTLVSARSISKPRNRCAICILTNRCYRTCSTVKLPAGSGRSSSGSGLVRSSQASQRPFNEDLLFCLSQCRSSQCLKCTASQGGTVFHESRRIRSTQTNRRAARGKRRRLVPSIRQVSPGAKVELADLLGLTSVHMNRIRGDRKGATIAGAQKDAYAGGLSNLAIWG
jgi:hypothetical protein